MTEPSASERSAWERVDRPAVTPGSIDARRGLATAPAGRPGAFDAGRRRAPRLRRSTSPVLAALDHGGDVAQRRLRSLAVASTVLLVPIVALDVWVIVVGFDRFDPDEAWFPSLGSGVGSGVEDVAPFLGAVATSVGTAVVGFAVASIVLADRFGRSVPGPLEAVRRTVRRLPAIVVAWLLGHWWQPLLVLIAVSADPEAIGGLIVIFGGIAWLGAAAMLFVVPSMVAEGLGPTAAVRRSWHLYRGASGVAFSFVALTTLVGSLFLVGAATLAPLLQSSGFLAFGDVTWIAQGVLVQLGVLLVIPLVAACTAQLYVEVRIEREGLDLELDAVAAFGSSGAVAWPEGAGRDPIGDGAPA